MLFLLWSPFCIQPVFIATSPYNILVIFLSLIQKAIGFLGITSIFLFYFILTKSLYPFINQTFLGLFDFAKENTTYHGIFFYLSLLLIIIDITIASKKA